MPTASPLASNQETSTSAKKESIAVYVHTPFCPTKCGYCDFNSYAMEGEIVERTVRAIIAEIERSPLRGRPARTIFFGGGTPTFLQERQLLSIFEKVMEVHPPVEGCEITSEANPGTVDMPKFRAMRRAGFNRISLGAQSFLDSDLVRLGRVHRSGEIERAVGAAHEAGFDNLNLDLMFALPGQSRRAWNANLGRALALEPEHLSLYCLTIEPNTAFYKLHLKGQLDLPDDDEQVAMYDRCLERTAAVGLTQYEISNFAKPGRECRHNLSYWRAEEYAGYGPGAVGAHGTPRLADSVARLPENHAIQNRAIEVSKRLVRFTNLKHPAAYCKAVETGHATAFEVEPLEEPTLRMERIMLGLRLNEGLPTSGLQLDAKAIAKLVARGWVESGEDWLKLTPAGRHFCSEVTLELI